MKEHKIPCPRCHLPMRHRVVSNLRYCANPNCLNYKGIPPINVPKIRNDSLVNAFSDEVWQEVEKELHTSEVRQ